MTTYRSKSFLITRRTFAASLLASAALGIGIGEVAAPLAQSQAQPLAAVAEGTGCMRHVRDQRGQRVCRPRHDSDRRLEVSAARRPGLPGRAQPQLLEDDLDHRPDELDNTAILKQNSKFQAIKGPLLRQEKQCLGG